MLTIIARDPDGNEVVEEREFVSRTVVPMTDLEGSVTRGRGVRMWTPGEQETIFDESGHSGWDIFVMNRFGSTVATYRLRGPRSLPPADDRIVIEDSSFRVPVDAVLEGARELSDVAVVGLDADGKVEVFSSMATPQTLALLDRARPHIDALTTEAA